MTSSDEIEMTTDLNAEQPTEAANISYQFFLHGLPNSGKTRFIESIPAIFGDEFIDDGDVMQSKFDRLRQLSSKPQMTVARDEYTFTIKGLVRDRYTRTITIHDNAGKNLSTAFEKIDRIPDAEAIKQEQQAEIVSDFTNADAVIYLVGHDALFSEDRKETQEIEFHFQTLSRQLAEQRHGRPPLAILVTKCDLSDDAQSKQAPNTFSESFVDRVEQRIKSRLFTNDSLPKKYRIFPITSFGFSNYKELDKELDKEQDSSKKAYLPKEDQLQPAGGNAAFTWLAEQIDNRENKGGYAWTLTGVGLAALAIVVAMFFSNITNTDPSPCEAQWSEYDTIVNNIGKQQHNSIRDIAKSLRQLASYTDEVKDLDFATDQGDCSASEFKEQKEDCLAQIESATKTLQGKLEKTLTRNLNSLKNTPNLNNVEEAFKLYAKAMEAVDRSERKQFASKHAYTCVHMANIYYTYTADITPTDSTKLVAILGRYANSSCDPNHDIRDRYRELLSQAEQRWQEEWHDGIENIVRHNSDPVEMYRRLREFAAKKNREAQPKTTWDSSLRDEPQQLLAFCEFLVGTKDEEAKQDGQQFKRKLRLLYLKTAALGGDDDLQIRIFLTPETGNSEPSTYSIPVHNWLHHAKIDNTYDRANAPTFSFTWKPGDSLNLKIRDIHVWGILGSTWVNHGNLPRTRQPKGQELMEFHGSKQFAPHGGHYTEIELEVENMIQCPEFFREIIEQTAP